MHVKARAVARTSNPFLNWIATLGVTGVARVLDVTPQTVKQWQWGKCHPTGEMVRKIRAATAGRVQYHHVLDRKIPKGSRIHRIRKGENQ